MLPGRPVLLQLNMTPWCTEGRLTEHNSTIETAKFRIRRKISPYKKTISRQWRWRFASPTLFQAPVCWFLIKRSGGKDGKTNFPGKWGTWMVRKSRSIAPKSASCQCPLVAAAPCCSPGHGRWPEGRDIAGGDRDNYFPRDVGRTCVLLRDSEIWGCIQIMVFICTVSPLRAGIMSFQD